MKCVLCINISRPEAKKYEYITYWLISSRIANCWEYNATLTSVIWHKLSHHQALILKPYFYFYVVTCNQLLKHYRTQLSICLKQFLWFELLSPVTEPSKPWTMLVNIRFLPVPLTLCDSCCSSYRWLLFPIWIKFQSSNPRSHLTSNTHPSGLTTAVSVYRVVF